MLLKHAADEAVKVMCIFDSDFHTPDQISKRKREAVDKGVWLHVWRRKETENYFLVPTTIARLIGDTAGRRTEPPTATEVAEQLEAEADALMDSVSDAYTQAFMAENRAGGVRQANKRVRELIKIRQADSVDNSELSRKTVISGGGC